MQKLKKRLFDEPATLPGLRGKFALITGSTKGMGRVIAAFLAECGVNVAINGRDRRETESVADAIAGSFAVQVLACPADVGRLDQVKEMFRRLAAWSENRLHFLVSNAGYRLEDEMWEKPIHEMTDAQIGAAFEQVYRVDVSGARFCTREALRLMLPDPEKSGIVYISSTPAISGYKGTAYTEAKSALLGLMKDVAVEYAPQDIRANALALGNIQSGWYHHLPADKKQTLSAEAPMGRWGTAAEVAGVVVFLLSDLAGYITGQTIIVDGGKIIR